MHKRTRWIISEVMIGGLLLTGTAMASQNASPPPAHATLTAQVVSPANLDSCPTLSEGDHGGCVSLLQTELNTYDTAGLPVTGTFGLSTRQAVIKFQQENGVTPAQGVVGPHTKATLDQTALRFRLAPHKKDPGGIYDNIPVKSPGISQRPSNTPANSPAGPPGPAAPRNHLPGTTIEPGQPGHNYNLFYRYDSSAPANCPARGTKYLANEGIVPLKHYSIPKIDEVASEDNGALVVTRDLQDGFSTARKELYCVHNAFVYEYFGDNAVQREETETDISNYGGGGSIPFAWTYTPWKNSQWPITDCGAIETSCPAANPPTAAPNWLP